MAPLKRSAFNQRVVSDDGNSPVELEIALHLSQRRR